MTNILLRLFAEDLEGFEPDIRMLEKPIRILGMTMDTDMSRIYRDVPILGKHFNEETGAFSYTLGDVVTNVAHVPDGLTAFEIPAGRYAVFPVRPKNRFGWGLAIANVKRYAYEVWLPQSGYEAAGVIDDFEYHDDRSLRKHRPEIDLYVAIKKKQ